MHASDTSRFDIMCDMDLNVHFPVEAMPTGNFNTDYEQFVCANKLDAQNMSNNRPSCMFTLSTSQIGALTPHHIRSLRFLKESFGDAHCKRRLDFSSSRYLGLKPQTVAVARRNERERNRVKLINMTFATLRDHLPQTTKNGKSKKMSKVETLRNAIEYIRHLQDLVDENDAVDAVLDNSSPSARLTVLSSSVADLHSPSSFSDGSLDALSAEEEELVDFASWF